MSISAANPAGLPHVSLSMLERANKSLPRFNGGGELHSSCDGHASSNRAVIAVAFCSQRAVSYTHLDVYKRQEQSISNQFQQIEQGQQIFTNTVKIATTALQAYNVAKQQYNLVHQMILAPRMLYSRFLSPTSDLLLLQQISNTYGNSMGWLNSANTGKGAASSYQQVSVPTTANVIPGYSSASVAGQLQIAAQGATVDINDSVMTNNLQALGTIRANPVSYTHLDVYKRQTSRRMRLKSSACTR